MKLNQFKIIRQCHTAILKLVRNNNNYFTVIAFSIIIFFFLLSFLIVSNDNNFEHRWLAFSIYITACLLVVILYLKLSINKEIIHKYLHFKEVFIFGSILILTDIISFLNLKAYPFVSVFDEVRDGGLDAMNIVNGSILNIFAYGRYEAHGLIIPTISSFFYNYFGSSVLTYRFPSAVLACLSIAVIYILVRLLSNKTAAFLSAFVLASLPLQIFFARTQIVVAFSIFLTSVILLSLYLLFQKKRDIDYILLGTILGFSFGFHAAVRVVAILALLSIILIRSWGIFRGIIKKENIYDGLLKLLLIILFCFLGFGPRLIYSDKTTFFHTSRLTAVSTPSEQTSVKDNYLKSLMVWVYEPTTYFYPDHKPIFPPFLAIFFLIGLGFTVFIQKKSFSYILVFLAVTIPLFASAITDLINADHRIVTLLPVGSILVGLGFSYILSLIRYKYLRFLFIFIICGYLSFQIAAFFIDQSANKKYDIKDYLSMHIIQFIKNRTTPAQKQYCLYVSPENQLSLNLPHYLEQYQYFLPDIKIIIKSDSGIKNNEAYIFNNICSNGYQSIVRKQTISCSNEANALLCPLNFKDDIDIHY